MYKFLSRNGQVLGFALGALICILFLISWLSGTSSMMAMPEDERYKTGIFDVGLLGAVFLVLVALAVVVIFGVMQTANNFKSSVRGLIGVAIMVGIFLVSYATASADTTGIVADAAKKMGASGNTIRMIGAGLNTVVFLSIITFAALIVSEIRNFFK